MAPKLNLNKLRDRLNRHKNKSVKKTGGGGNTNPFFNLQEGKNKFRLVAWPDAEEEEGERIPDFKELSFYYNLKFPEKDEQGIIKKDNYGKQIINKPPISCKSRGLRDCVDEMMSGLFNKEGKGEDEVKEDKELAMKLWPTPTYYLLGIDRSREDEGLKIWSISGKTQYENLLDIMLDPEEGPMILDTTESGYDIEIKVNMVDDPQRDGQKKRVIGTPTTAKKSCPLSDDAEKVKALMNDENFPDPSKIFAKRFLTPEELDVHFDRWLCSTSGEKPDISEGDGTEVKAPASEDESEKEEASEEKAEETAAPEKKVKKTAKKSEKTKVDAAFDDLNEDDEDED